MLVACLPGVNRENLRDTVRDLHTEVFNLRGASGGRDAYEGLLAYLQWASKAAQVLGNQITTTDIDRLVLTRRYELLLSGVGSLLGTVHVTEPLVNRLVSIELDQRIAAFDEALKALDQQIDRWSGPEEFVLPDTSVYIEHPQKLEELDFAPMIPVREEPIHVLVPIAVVDELDGLKQSKDRTVRWRAGYTLAVLDRVFERPTEPTRLRESDFSALDSGGIPRGEVTMELVFDPPGHVRLSITDDEIIDRSLAVEPLAGRKITLLTYDTGQSTRARAEGLRVVKLTSPIGDEPR